MLEVTIDLPIRMPVLVFDGLRVDGNEAAHRELVACGARYRAGADQRGEHAPGSVEGVEHARDLFHALGIDPTKRRPSSEALLNRALKGKSLPRINSLVDVGNWCSLDFLLPLGLYDAARIRGGVTLRRGREGEGYRAIGDRDINLAGRYLLADDEGPFGSPLTDSLRTAVTVETTEAVVLIYAPLAYPQPPLAAHAQTMAERVTTCCGGRAVENRVVV